MLFNFESRERTLLASFPRENRYDHYDLAGWSPDSRKIVYQAEIEGQFDLFIVDIETLEVQQLTNDPETETYIYWSPVANHLLVGVSQDSDPFFHPPYVAQALYLIDEDGNRRLLAEFEELVQFTWSPDGRQIAFSTFDDLCLLTIEDLSQYCPLREIFPDDKFYFDHWDPQP
jgi:Tol biopolymer transport system component